MRAIILFVIGLVFGTGLGFIISAPTQGHDRAGHSDTGHYHSALSEWIGPAPSLALSVSDDIGVAKNLFINVIGFTFSPEAVNAAPVASTGHVHIFVDGVKVARAYSPWMHLADAPSGSTIRVTLNANDHTGWVINSRPIMAEIIVP